MPTGQIRAIRDGSGSIPIYEDQFGQINEIVKGARTIENAQQLLYTSHISYDRHHSDSHVPTVKDLEIVNSQKQKYIKNSKLDQSYAPPATQPMEGDQDSTAVRKIGSHAKYENIQSQQIPTFQS